MTQTNLERSPIKRREFVSRFMDAGLTYAQAVAAYKTMCSVIEDGIVSGSKVILGSVGALAPVYKPPRDYHMHFRRTKGNKVQRGVHRTFFMDGRFEYRFKLFKAFAQNHKLLWLPEFPDELESADEVELKT